jgi:hypothetical protein
MTDVNEAPQRTVIGRTLALGINVSEADQLPKVGRYLAKFLTEIDHPHGPFDLNLVVSVNPTDASAIGPVEIPTTQDEPQITVEIVQVDDIDGEEEAH